MACSGGVLRVAAHTTDPVRGRNTSASSKAPARCAHEAWGIPRSCHWSARMRPTAQRDTQPWIPGSRNRGSASDHQGIWIRVLRISVPRGRRLSQTMSKPWVRESQGEAPLLLRPSRDTRLHLRGRPHLETLRAQSGGVRPTGRAEALEMRSLKAAGPTGGAWTASTENSRTARVMLPMPSGTVLSL